MSSWFTSSKTLEDASANNKPSAPRQSDTFAIYPFFLKKGDAAKVTFLDEDNEPLPVIHYHEVPNLNGQGYSRVPCAAKAATPGRCPICEYTKSLPKEQQWKTRANEGICLTVLDDRGRTNDEGVKYPPTKRLRISNKTDTAALRSLRQQLVDDTDGLLASINQLQYTTVVMSRDENDAKSPRIGKVGQVVGVLDSSKYDIDLSPLTQEEILKYFVSDEAEIQAFYAKYEGLLNGDSPSGITPQIKDI